MGNSLMSLIFIGSQRELQWCFPSTQLGYGHLLLHDLALPVGSDSALYMSYMDGSWVPIFKGYTRSGALATTRSISHVIVGSVSGAFVLIPYKCTQAHASESLDTRMVI